MERYQSIKYSRWLEGEYEYTTFEKVLKYITHMVLEGILVGTLPRDDRSLSFH
jgi:hypothetical protein